MSIEFYSFFLLRRSKILLDHWPKPFKVRVNTFRSFKYRRRVKASGLYLKPSPNTTPSNTSRHVTSSMHTNHEWVSQYSNSARQAYQWDDVFPPEIFHTAKLSGRLSHSHLHTHTHQIFNNSISTKVRSNRAMSI
jgi:hypothetical protein